MKWTPQEKELLRQSASADRNVACAAQDKIAKALELPLRQGVQPGDVIGDIFERIEAQGTSTVEFPLDWLSPGSESEYVAYTVPRYGAIPQRLAFGDYVNIPVYDIAASMDWDIKYARDARWDIVAKMGERLRNQFVKKKNDDGWHTLLAAGYNRNIIVADSDSAAGMFSVRLVSLLKTVMGRNGGGNTSSLNGGVLTDLYISIESEADIRSWNVDIIDEFTRREIFTTPEGTLNRIFSVNLHPLFEFGEGQEYDSFFTSTLGASFPNAGNQKLEMAVGLDLRNRDSFVMPVAEDLTIMNDDTLMRSRMRGMFGWMSLGFGVLDSRRILMGAV
jgi:hypothetical protein